MTRTSLGPVALDVIDEDAVLSWVETRIASRTPSHIVTLNALMFNTALDDPSLRGVIADASLVIPDSIGIVWAARALIATPVRRLTGIDLLHRMCRRAAERGYSVFLLGSRPGTADRASQELARLYPGLRITGTHHGFFSTADEPALIERINGSRPDLLFVAMDVPRQERWIAGHLPALGVPVVMGVGGSFDVIAGELKRAPRFFQGLGIEWLFRLLQQPWRIARMKGLPLFVVHILRLKWSLIR